MQTSTLQVTLCRTKHGAPLATIDGLPAGSADLIPEQLRALALTRERIAADAEAQAPVNKRCAPRRCTYPLNLA